MKEPRLYTICAVLMLLMLTGFRADKPVRKEGIQWMTIEQAFALTQKEPRKVLIDLYTDWCGWCKVMDRETFKNPKVVDYVNAHYYAVKLDAEQKAKITLGGQQFEYLSEGGRGIHQLALALTNNQPSFPTTIFLDDQFQMIQPLPGYMKPREFHQVITFFGENYHKKEAFEAYKSTTYTKFFPGK